MGGVGWSYVHSGASAESALTWSNGIKCQSDSLGFSRIWSVAKLAELFGPKKLPLITVTWRYLPLAQRFPRVWGMHGSPLGLECSSYCLG
jgi:hypothetical protein